MPTTLDAPTPSVAADRQDPADAVTRSDQGLFLHAFRKAVPVWQLARLVLCAPADHCRNAACPEDHRSSHGGAAGRQHLKLARGLE
jgi:hypothetical protein